MTITAHHITNEWQLLAHVIQTRAMHESHTGANVAVVLKTATEEWGIANKQIVLVTDKLAKRYLSIPGTRVSAERVFSTAGDIVTAQRSMLTNSFF